MEVEIWSDRSTATNLCVWYPMKVLGGKQVHQEDDSRLVKALQSNTAMVIKKQTF